MDWVTLAELAILVDCDTTDDLNAYIFLMELIIIQVARESKERFTEVSRMVMGLFIYVLCCL